MRKSISCWSIVTVCASCLVSALVSHGEERPVVRQTAANGPREATKKTSLESVEVRDFEVRVDNRPAGTHRLTYKSEGDTHQVAFHTDVKIDVIVYAYVFKFRGTEVWRDGKLLDADIHCEDGGKKRSLALKTDGTVQEISFNGKSVPAGSLGLMTTAYWRLPSEDLLEKSLPIVDVDTGATHRANFTIVGPATVSTAGGSLTCRHFKIDGPSPAELWFDDRNRLVRQRSSEEGHLMELRLKQIKTPTGDR